MNKFLILSVINILTCKRENYYSLIGLWSGFHETDREGLWPVLYNEVTTSAAMSLFFSIMIFIFSIIAGSQCSLNFLLYSMVIQLHIHVHILFSHIIMLHHK